MTDIDHFAASTRLFNQSKFLEGLEEVDKLIQQDPHNSVLYANRSLFLVELGHIRQAIKDLKSSIELDYLNYISYFNLFSIHVRQNNLENALQDLHCALSAIYLIAAKQNKSYEYVTKAVYYAKNNTQARVLKGLMELEHGKFKQAHEELVWACGIQTDNIMLAKVRDLIKKIGDSVSKDSQEESSVNSQRRQTRRLQSAFDKPQNYDVEAEIRDRVNQFNKIYQIVSDKQGLVTQKVGQRGDKKQIFMRQKSNASQTSNNIKTDIDKEIVHRVELTGQKLQSAVSEKAIENVEAILQINKPVQQEQQTHQILESNAVQLQKEVTQQNIHVEQFKTINEIHDEIVVLQSKQEQIINNQVHEERQISNAGQKQQIQSVPQSVGSVLSQILGSVQPEVHYVVFKSNHEQIKQVEPSLESIENIQSPSETVENTKIHAEVIENLQTHVELVENTQFHGEQTNQ